MSKKTFLQFFLLMFALSIFFFTFYYFNNNQIKELDLALDQTKLTNNNSVNSNITIENKDQFSNVLSNLSYENFDTEGNRYVIVATRGSIKSFNSNIIYMEEVIATIYLEDSSKITIASKNAIFNNVTFNSKFYDKVQLDYLLHQFNSNNLELKFNENLISMNENVIYKNSDTKLMADTILIDLISKDSKIFMNDANKKIKILNF
tara:strand:+ start:1190 stop:1804 length:615 start_codon:yes stop_codon:yes gene_type:complete